MQDEIKRLYKSRNDRVICGVCGGFAEYLKMDPTIVRLIMVLIALTGGGIIAYLIAAIVMPERPM
ncbi:MAG: PspC domain-containing protein [bacterium]|nr:PspC domain-containing protein [bacterium]